MKIRKILSQKRSTAKTLERVEVETYLPYRTIRSIRTPLPPGAIIIETYNTGYNNLAKVTIYQNPKTYAYVYHVEEPPVSPIVEKLYRQIREMFQSMEIEIPRNITEEEIVYEKYIQEALKEIGYEEAYYQYPELRYYIIRDTVGWRVIDVLVRDPNVEEIDYSNIALGCLSVMVRSRKVQATWLDTNIKLSEEELTDLIEFMAFKTNKPISVAEPLLEARTREGYRLAANLKEVGNNPSFTIRKFPEKPLSLTELVRNGTMSSLMAAYLWTLVERQKFILIIGGMGSGKTTVLQALTSVIPRDKKVVTIEDTPELRLAHPRWQALYTRRSIYGTERDITLFDLARYALRTRAQYIIIGEVRDREIQTLVQMAASVSRDTPVLVRINGEVKLAKIGDIIDEEYGNAPDWTKVVPKQRIEVLSLTKDGKVKFKPVQWVLRHRVSEIYKVQYVEGEVKATGSHSVFVLNEDTLNIEVKRVDELKPGDILISFVKKEPLGRRNIIDLGATEYDVYIPTIREFADRLGVNIIENDRDTYKLVELGSTVLAEPLKRMFGENVHSKRVPSELWGADQATIRAFLDIYMADGSRTQKRGTKTYSTVNEWLAYEVAWIARIGGYSSSVWPVKGTGRNVDKTYWYIEIKDPEKCGPDNNRGRFIPLNPLQKLARILEPIVSGNSKDITSYFYDKSKRFVRVETAKKILEYILKNRRKPVSDEARKLIERIEWLINSETEITVVKEVKKIPYNDYVYDFSVPDTEAFFGGTIPVLLHNSGHGSACLPSNEYLLVRDSNGVKLIEIGELVEKTLSKKKLDVEVLAYDVNSGAFKWKPIRRVYKVPTSKWVIITTRGGRQLKVTPDHKLAVLLKNKHIIYKKASDIVPGDKLLLVNELVLETKRTEWNILEEALRLGYLREHGEISAVKRVKYGAKGRGSVPSILGLNEDLGYIIGFYLARGTINDTRIVFNLERNDAELVSILVEKIRNTFNIVPEIENDHEASRVIIRCDLLAKIFAKLFNIQLDARTLPDWMVFETPLGFVKGVIKGYWIGSKDMYKGEKDTVTRTVLTPSRELAFKIHYILKRLGINSSVRELSKEMTSTHDRIVKYNHTLYEVRIHGDESLNKFAKIIGINVPTTTGTEIRDKALRNVLVDVIESINIVELDNPEWSYDIEVADYHNFVYNASVISSNCTFHAENPDLLFLRMTSPPLSVQPSFLLTISSILLQQQVWSRKARGLVRRTTKIWEVTGLKPEIRVGEIPIEFKEVFTWDPFDDYHYPDEIEDLVEESKQIQIIAKSSYGDEEWYDMIVWELGEKKKAIERLVKENVLDFYEVTERIYMESIRIRKKLQERFDKG